MTWLRSCIPSRILWLALSVLLIPLLYWAYGAMDFRGTLRFPSHPAPTGSTGPVSLCVDDAGNVSAGTCGSEGGGGARRGQPDQLGLMGAGAVQA